MRRRPRSTSSYGIAAVRSSGWAKSLSDIVKNAKGRDPEMLVEIEADDEASFDCAVDAAPDWILLDNMDIPTLRRAVTLADRRTTLEASGGVTLENARDIATTGVDSISIGWLTHSAPALDVGLDFECESGRYWRPSTRASTLTG